jgi:hypothetical protein
MLRLRSAGGLHNLFAPLSTRAVLSRLRLSRPNRPCNDVDVDGNGRASASHRQRPARSAPRLSAAASPRRTGRTFSGTRAARAPPAPKPPIAGPCSSTSRVGAKCRRHQKYDRAPATRYPPRGEFLAVLTTGVKWNLRQSLCHFGCGPCTYCCRPCHVRVAALPSERRQARLRTSPSPSVLQAHDTELHDQHLRRVY